MKHILLTILITLSFLLVSCRGSNVVGKWKYADTGRDGFIEFTEDDHVISYSKGNTPKRGTYRIDDTKSPKYLDMTMDADNVNPDRRNEAKVFNLAGIYKFEGNKLVLKSANDMEVGNIHPSDFSESAGYITINLERYDGAIPMEYQSKPVEIRVATPKP